MPIKFRCPHCKQFLGISQSKAGALTDCPMCGRTVRVPGLDGRVEPLPPPELDHGDRSLAQALDALAALESGPAVVAEIETAPHKAAAVPMLTPSMPTVEAVPIELPVLEAPLSAPPSADPIGDLASLPPGSPPSGRLGEASTARSWTRLALSGTAAAGLILGTLLGRWTVPAAGPGSVSQAPIRESVPTKSDPAGPAEQPALESAPHPISATGSLTGQVTYTNSEGQTRPDAGARILVLPLQHPNVSRIAAGSFQSGATSQDLKLAQAVIRTLGGDFALVDATGKYTIQVANSGQYQLVILSRYQPRSEKQSTEEVAGFLHVWFDQPQVLLGQTQFFRAEMGLDVQKSQSRDHSFPIAE